MYKVEVSNRGSYLFNVKSADFQFAIDVNGKGVTPPDALLASVGSCLGVYIRKYAEGSKLPIADFDISVEADFSKTPPACFRKINVAIDLKGVTLDERRQKAFLDFIRNCPVHNTLKNGPDVEIKIV